MNINNLIMNLINNNPMIANNPQYKEWIQIIQSGDSARGQQLANNLCQTFGMSKDQAIQNARRFFRV